VGLRLTRNDLASIRVHGESTYPHECCGILLGRNEDGHRVVEDVVPMRNANESSPQNRFDFDPKEHLRVQRGARERGMDIIGFYHSHPDHPARPSQYDLDHAAWPGYSYVIVSVEKSVAAEANSFELAADRSHFIQEPVEIVD
jgi:proteasome lid subunit RPN8/RPN11